MEGTGERGCSRSALEELGMKWGLAEKGNICIRPPCSQEGIRMKYCMSLHIDLQIKQPESAGLKASISLLEVTENLSV